MNAMAINIDERSDRGVASSAFLVNWYDLTVVIAANAINAVQIRPQNMCLNPSLCRVVFNFIDGLHVERLLFTNRQSLTCRMALIDRFR